MEFEIDPSRHLIGSSSTLVLGSVYNEHDPASMRPSSIYIPSKSLLERTQFSFASSTSYSPILSLKINQYQFKSLHLCFNPTLDPLSSLDTITILSTHLNSFNMFFSSVVVLPTVVLLSMLQLCPAPFVPLLFASVETGLATAGVIISGVGVVVGGGMIKFQLTSIQSKC